METSPSMPPRRRRRWPWILAAIALIGVIGLTAAGYVAARRFKPFVHEQARRYLDDRFGSGAELGDFDVSVNWTTRMLRVTGRGLKLPFRRRDDLPALIAVRSFSVSAPVRELWDEKKRVREVKLDGLEINIPPKRERKATAPEPPTAGGKPFQILVDKVEADGAMLRIWPDNPAKPPREFEIHELELTGAGTGLPLKYQARLTNPAPKGLIKASGEFGPWVKEDPGASPLTGDYTFKNADLGVFKGIGGKLDSEGRFAGVLERLEVDGWANVPDFRLKVSGNRVPLKTNFHSIVDGTSGDTLLEPVKATLGSTYFTARGGIVRLEGKKGREISLAVHMPKGRVQDLLRLAMKSQPPMMAGDIVFRSKLVVPPGDLDVIEKIRLAGTFEIDQARFSTNEVQDKLDDLSRRALGQPKNPEISDVLSGMRGTFELRDAVMSFSTLHFSVPGAGIQLAGRYELESEQLDFRGAARLQAKVSQTMTGWKRWALKPVDPFFSKGGAGTMLPIKIVGTREKPEFGLNRGKDKEETRARTP